MAGKTTKLKYAREYYFPEAYESGVLSAKEARAEYARLRKVANMRLATLGASRFSEWNIYRKNAGRFSAPASKISDKDIGKALYDVMRFITSKSSTVSGARQIELKALATLRSSRDPETGESKPGLTFLNKSNIAAFGEFMKRARQLMTSKLFDSERAVELFEAATDKGLNPLNMQRTRQSFEKWLEDSEELAAMPEKRGGADQKYYRRKLTVARKRG